LVKVSSKSSYLQEVFSEKDSTKQIQKIQEIWNSIIKGKIIKRQQNLKWILEQKFLLLSKLEKSNISQLDYWKVNIQIWGRIDIELDFSRSYSISIDNLEIPKYMKSWELLAKRHFNLNAKNEFIFCKSILCLNCIEN